MYRLFCFFILSFHCNSSLAQINIQRSVDYFVQDIVNKNASISIKIIDLDADSTLASYREQSSLICASTAKLFTTSSALKVLGKSYQAKTRFYCDGIVDSLGVLHGDLWIRGGGDVSLGSRYFNSKGDEFDFMEAWLDSLNSIGIKKINGKLITDGSEFGYAGVPDGWDWSDMGNYYGVGASGINFYDNTLRFYFKTGRPGGYVKFIGTKPVIKDLFFQHDIVAANISRDRSYIYGSPFSSVRFGRGRIPAYKDSFCVKGSMPDPEMQLAVDFGQFLETRGINILEGVSSNRFLRKETDFYTSLNYLFSYSGQDLMTIINKTNLYSVNLYAEAILNLIGYNSTGDGSTKSSISALYRLWKNKIDLTGLTLKDGSGLSRKNAISASHFCQLLESIYESNIYSDFKGSLPIAGRTGTLKYVCSGQKGANRIFAKSGTLGNVKAYSGYVETVSGKNLAFALIVNNFNCTRSEIVKKMESVFNAMASY